MSGNDFGSLFGDMRVDTRPVRKPSTNKPPKYHVPICIVPPLGQITNNKAVQDAIGQQRLPRTFIRQLSKIPADGIISMLHNDILPVVYKGDSYQCLDEFEILGRAKLLLGSELKVPVAVYTIPDPEEQIKFAAIRRAKRLMEETGDVEVAADMLAHLTASGYLNITKKVELANALGVSVSMLRNYDLEGTLEAAGKKRKRGGKHTKNNNGK